MLSFQVTAHPFPEYVGRAAWGICFLPEAEPAEFVVRRPVCTFDSVRESLNP
jgi:hypothetical protein